MTTELDIRKLRSTLFEFVEKIGAANTQRVLKAIEKNRIDSEKMTSQAIERIEKGALKMLERAGLEAKKIINEVSDGEAGPQGKPGKPGKDANERRIGKVVLEQVFKKLSNKKELTAQEVSRMVRSAIPRVGGGGDVIHYEDLSDLCDGSKKIFTLPPNRRVIKVECTDAPGGIYRPLVDFVVSGRTLTLDSAVIAPQLGATLLVYYVR